MGAVAKALGAQSPSSVHQEPCDQEQAPLLAVLGLCCKLEVKAWVPERRGVRGNECFVRSTLSTGPGTQQDSATLTGITTFSRNSLLRVDWDRGLSTVSSVL